MSSSRLMPAGLSAVLALALSLAAGAAAGGAADPRPVPEASESAPAAPVVVAEPGPSDSGSDQDTPESAPSASGCAERTALQVQETYDQIQDLRARFSQTTRSVAFGSAGGLEAPTRGTVAFAKPGKRATVSPTRGLYFIVHEPSG